MKLTKKYISLIVASMLLSACSGEQETDLPKAAQNLDNLTTYSVDEQPDSSISFTKDVVYGDSEEVTMGYMGDIAVDHLGRVFVVDMQQMVIYVFEPNGRFHDRLGREGRGPGEFGVIKNLHIHNHRLYVYDSRQQRVTAFTLDSLAVDKTNLLARSRGNYKELDNAAPYIYQLYVRNNGSYLAEFVSDSSRPRKAWQKTATKGLFYKLDNTGSIASNKLLEIKEETRLLAGAFIQPIELYFGNALIVLSNDNSIYWAGPDDFLIKGYSPDGDYQHAFYYPVEKIPLTEETATEADVRDDYIENMSSIAPPPTWPVITDMQIDDQERLWIATTVEDMTIYQWWVLNLDGQLITKFNWPRDKPIQMIKGASIYTKETVEETGLRYIVRYSFEMEKQ